MVQVPEIVAAIQALDLAAEQLRIGDTVAVATKGASAYAEIDQWSVSAGLITDEINTLTAALRTAVDDLVAAQDVRSIDVGGARRHSRAYIEAIRAEPVTSDDVFAGVELHVSGIAPDRTAPTSEQFVAELGPGGPRWGGPVLVVDLSAYGEANERPVALAGPDALIQVGEPWARTAGGSDRDGRITAWSWQENGTEISSAQTLLLTPTSAAVRQISLVVTDDAGATSEPDTLRLTVVAKTSGTSAYQRAVSGRTGVIQRATTNVSTRTRSIQGSRRPVFTADGRHLVVSRGSRGTTRPNVHDIINRSGVVIRADIRTEREAMASFTDPDSAYGIRDTASSYQFSRCSWRTNVVEILYSANEVVSIGDGLGRLSHDDKYVVLHRESTARLVSVDARTGATIAQIDRPSGYRWSTITPSGAYVLIGRNGAIDRYTRTLTGRTTISSDDAAGDCVLGVDGRDYFLQSGARPRLIDIGSGAVTYLDIGGASSATGHVSGASRVPGYAALSWRVAGIHEVATVEIARGSSMWVERARWTGLNPAAESRDYAQAAATPSPDGRSVVYRAAANPGTGDYNLNIVS